MRNYCILLCLTFAFAVNLSSGCSDTVQLENLFEGTDGSFILTDNTGKTVSIFNEARANKRFSPCSTFKIPNTLISIESGIVDDESFTLKWDSLATPGWENWTEEPLKFWPKDHDLKSAFKYSVVWYYRELARQNGAEIYNEYLDRFSYGNKDISGGVDRFWLSSSLKISAVEQVSFLRKLYNEEFGFSAKSMEILKNIMKVEDKENYTLYAKTGGGEDDPNLSLGWYVGFVEKVEEVYFFALNLSGEDSNEISAKRIELTREILTELKIVSRP